ncbi:MAG TPA: bifunctional riboflavin kinase/FAD synthetase [Acidimicrobiales bacterium]|nr:bifunctional riboflavin kinase/FAD synthetase [Acidimicrobiales bacterium]
MIRDLRACPRPVDGCAVTIGAYDGVHRGHQLVIAEVRRRAAERGLATAVVTFDRHPATVVRPDSAPLLLSTLDQKLGLLDATGIDYVLVLTFDEARSKEPAVQFVDEVLVDCLRARLVAVGADFHFGHKREGNVELLRELGATRGYDVEVLDLVGLDGQPAGGGTSVSSTAIRAALAAGDLARANELLGRPHEVRGVVEHGDKRGRDWGFPTANIALPDSTALPDDGVYAGWYVRPDGSVHPAALSLGRRPTVYADHGLRLLEAHLLDFDGDLYGEAAHVRFVRRLRGQERYDDIADLVAQMHRDVDDTRSVLAADAVVEGDGR